MSVTSDFLTKARGLFKANKGERVIGAKYLERKWNPLKARWEYVYNRPQMPHAGASRPAVDQGPSLFDFAGIDTPQQEARKPKPTKWEQESDRGQGSLFDQGAYVPPAKEVAPVTKREQQAKPEPKPQPNLLDQTAQPKPEDANAQEIKELKHNIADMDKRLARLAATHMSQIDAGGRSRAKTTSYNARSGQYAELRDKYQARLRALTEPAKPPEAPKPVEDTSHLHVGDKVRINQKWGVIIDPTQLRPPRDVMPGQVAVQFEEGGRVINYAPSEMAETKTALDPQNVDLMVEEGMSTLKVEGRLWPQPDVRQRVYNDLKAQIKANPEMDMDDTIKTYESAQEMHTGYLRDAIRDRFVAQTKLHHANLTGGDKLPWREKRDEADKEVDRLASNIEEYRATVMAARKLKDEGAMEQATAPEPEKRKPMEYWQLGEWEWRQVKEGDTVLAKIKTDKGAFTTKATLTKKGKTAHQVTLDRAVRDADGNVVLGKGAKVRVAGVNGNDHRADNRILPYFADEHPDLETPDDDAGAPPEKKQQIDTLHSLQDVIDGKYSVGILGKGETKKAAEEAGMYVTKTTSGHFVYGQNYNEVARLAQKINRDLPLSGPEFTQAMGHGGGENAEAAPAEAPATWQDAGFQDEATATNRQARWIAMIEAGKEMDAIKKVKMADRTPGQKDRLKAAESTYVNARYELSRLPKAQIAYLAAQAKLAKERGEIKEFQPESEKRKFFQFEDIKHGDRIQIDYGHRQRWARVTDIRNTGSRYDRISYTFEDTGNDGSIARRDINDVLDRTEATGDTAAAAPHYTVEHERGWTYLSFDGKPERAIRAAMKEQLGARWDRNSERWYVMRDVSDADVQRIIGDTHEMRHGALADDELAAKKDAAKEAKTEQVEHTRAFIVADFKEKADAMTKQIDEKLNSGTRNQNVTHRRAGIIEGQDNEAKRLKGIQAALRGLGKLWEDGGKEAVPYSLSQVRTRAAVEAILRFDKVYDRKELQADSWLHEPMETLQHAGITDTWRLNDAKTELRKIMAAHQTVDPEADRKQAVAALERKIIGQKIPGFFSTPPDIARKVVETADIRPGMKILEPSAGKGNLIDTVIAHHPDADVRAIEQNSSLRDILKAKGHTLVGDDFLDHKDADYDRIVMNPPFENGQDGEHVQHAYSLLKPGGKLVAITSSHPFFADDKKAQAFRSWLDSVGGEHEDLGADAGYGKDHGRATGVSTHMVTITKPGTPTPSGLVRQSAEGRTSYSAPVTPAEPEPPTGHPATQPDAQAPAGWEKRLGGQERDHIKQVMQTPLLNDAQRDQALNGQDARANIGEGFTHVYYSPLRPLGSWARLDDGAETRTNNRMLYSKRALTPKELAGLELHPVSANARIDVAHNFLNNQYGKDANKVLTKPGSMGEEGSVIRRAPGSDRDWRISSWDANGITHDPTNYGDPKALIGHAVNKGHVAPSHPETWDNIQELHGDKPA